MTPAPYSVRPLGVLLVAVVAFFAGRLSDGATLKLPNVVPSITAPVEEKATAATFVYEKDEHAVPAPVLAALNKLNREDRIVATVYEADTKDGDGDVPDQYRVALDAAKKAGLPALVVTAGDKVLAVVKNPKDEQSVIEAAR